MKGKFKRAFSAFLAAITVFTSVPVSAAEAQPPVSFEEQEIDESIKNSGMFYISSPASEVQENANYSSIFRVQRNASDLPATKVILNIMDLTAKYGEDYKIKIYQNSLFGEKVQGANESQSLLEQILENEDEIIEVNETDILVNQETLTNEEKQELYEQDVEMLKDALGISETEAVTEETVEEASEAVTEETVEEASEAVTEETVEEPSEAVTEETVEEASETVTEETVEEASEAVTEETVEEVTEIYAEEVEKDPSLTDLKELATGLKSDKQPMDGGNTLDENVAEMLSSMSIELNSAYLNLEFAEGETEKWIEIIPKDNNEGDGNRTFQMFLATGAENASISQYSGINITIVDDEEQEDAMVSFSASNYFPEDGYIEVIVKREGAINQVITVDMYTEDGTAKSSRDYSPVDTTITFPYGIKERNIKIPIRSDYIGEMADFKIVLSNPIGCILGDGAEAKGIIRAGDESILMTASEDDLNAGISLAADVTVNSTVLGPVLGNDKTEGSWAYDDGSSYASGSTWKLTAYDSWERTSSGVEWNNGYHYDYSGWQIVWENTTGKPAYGYTTVSSYNVNARRWETIFDTETERWGRDTDHMYFDFERVEEIKVKLAHTEGWVGKTCRLNIYSVRPILRPFEVSLIGAEPLYFLDETGKYIKNTDSAALKIANQTKFSNGSTETTDTIVKFSGDTITVKLSNPKYSYIKGLKIVNNKTGNSKIIQNNLAVGTTSVSFKLTNEFITENVDYINFLKNGSKGKKGQFSVQAILGYYDTTVAITNDYRGSVTISNYGEAHGQVISGATYRIKNVNSGKYLVNQYINEKGSVEQNVNTNDAKSYWRVKDIGDGYYTLVNGSGAVLDVSGANPNNRTNIQTWWSNNTDAQNFALEQQRDGSYIIFTKISDNKRCLDVSESSTANGGSIIQYDYHGGNNQKWIFELVTPSDEQLYQIKNVNSGKYLINQYVDKAGTVTQGKNTNDARSYWRMSYTDDGYCTLINESGAVLDVKNSNSASGTQIWTYERNYTNAQKFTLERQSDGSYVFFTRVSGNTRCMDVGNASTENGASIIQYDYHGGNNQKWILEPVSTYAKLHKGDTITLKQTIHSEYTTSYTGSRIGMKIKENSNAKWVDNKTAYDEGTTSYTFLNDYSQIEAYLNINKKNNQIVVRVLTEDLSKFDTTKGIFTSPKTVNGKYTEYTVVTNKNFASGIHYEMTAITKKSDKDIAVWNPVNTSYYYSQETFYFKATDELEQNIITLTAKQADSQKYSLSASAYYADVALGQNTEGQSWVPASGVCISIGNAKYGITNENGKMDTVPVLGVSGSKVIYKIVASGREEYKVVTLNKNSSKTMNNGTLKVYDVSLGKITVASINTTVPYLASIVATNMNGTQNGDVISINNEPTFFSVTINNNGKQYKDTDEKTRTEKVIGVNFIIYDAQTKQEKSTIACVTQNSDNNGMSVWTGSYSFEKGKATEYSSSDRLYVQIITDRVIGNGKSMKYDNNGKPIGEDENPAFQQTTYAIVNTGYVFSESNRTEPVVQDIIMPTDGSFKELPLIGDIEVSMDIKSVSFNISALPNNAVRLSVGYSPEKDDKDSDKSGNKKQTGAQSNDVASLGMKEWGLKPLFGLFLDFGIAENNAKNTAKELVFAGGGVFIGIKGEFKLVQYFVIGVVPCYFGVSGESTLTSQTAISLKDGKKVSVTEIQNNSGSFEENFALSAGVIMENSVNAFVGAGLCGTLGVRGGIEFSANFISEPMVVKEHKDCNPLGLELSADIKVWVDAAIFSITIPAVNIAEEKFGYYEYMENLQKTKHVMSISEETGKAILLKDRTSSDAEWLAPEHSIQLFSTFEQTETMTLIENSYDRADAQLLNLGDGRILMAFVGDAGNSRDSQNRTAVMYSVYEDGSWTAPIMIQNDTTADFEPNLTDAGDKILLTWTSRNTDAEETPSNYLRSMEVYAAIIDKATLNVDSIERLTEDTYYDADPVGLYDDVSGDMLVYYLKSEVTEDFETSVTPEKNESMIVYMLYDASQNQWARTYYYDNEVDDEEAEEILVQQFGGQRFLSSPLYDFGTTTENPDGIIDPIIVDFDAISYNGLGVYTFTVDEDNNMDTSADRELFVQAYDFEQHKTYVPIRITNDNVADARPQLVRNGDNTYLFWLQNEKDVRYLNVSHLIKNGVADDGTILDDYELILGCVFFTNDEGESVNPTFGSYEAYVDQDDNLFITWLQPVRDENGNSSQEVFASAFIDRENGSSWSSGVQLTESGEFNDEIAFVTDEEGNLFMVNNQYQMDLSTLEYEVSDSKLVSTKFKTVGSMDVKEVVYSDNTPIAGEDMEVSITVKNNGLKPATGYTMKVYEVVNGVVGTEAIYETTYNERVTPSSNNTELMIWTIPQNLTELETLSLYITVQETDMEEVSEFTSDSIEIRAEYELTDCIVTEEADGFYVSYTITNTGNISATVSEDGTGDKVILAFDDLYGTGKEYDAFMTAMVGNLSVGESDVVKMPITIPEEIFTFGYTNAYMEVQNAEGKALTDAELLSIELKFPYNIIINDDETLEVITLKEGESLALSGKYSPDDFYVNGDIVFFIEDNEIASIDENGNLVANAMGTTELSAKILPFGGEKTIEVVVEKNAVEDEPSEEPSETPSEEPSETPSEKPSETPSEEPSEVPSEKPSGTPGETGDDTNIALWVTILGIGIISVASSMAIKKKKRSN